MTPMISTIRREKALMDSIVCTACDTTAPPLTATSDAACTSRSAARAPSAFWFTVAVRSSMDAVVRSSSPAWASVSI